MTGTAEPAGFEAHEVRIAEVARPTISRRFFREIRRRALIGNRCPKAHTRSTENPATFRSARAGP